MCADRRSCFLWVFFLAWATHTPLHTHTHLFIHRLFHNHKRNKIEIHFAHFLLACSHSSPFVIIIILSMNKKTYSIQKWWWLDKTKTALLYSSIKLYNAIAIHNVQMCVMCASVEHHEKWIIKEHIYNKADIFLFGWTCDEHFFQLDSYYNRKKYF